MKELRKNIRGHSTLLVCADRTTKRSLPAFYHSQSDGSGTLKSEAEFIDLTKNLLSLVVKPTAQAEISFDAEPLGAMIRELFDNTHRYAQRNVDNEAYKRSVRGIYLAHQDLSPVALSKMAYGYHPLDRYLNANKEPNGSGKSRNFLELSVFDSGPGLAARFLGQNITPDFDILEEYKLVNLCFKKNAGTMTRPGGGAGLSRVLTRLKAAGGFLRIRTGRLSLYKDFAASKGALGELTSQDLELSDASDGPPVSRAWAAGTVLTLILPLSAPKMLPLV